MADVTLDHVTRRHPDGTVAVADLSLTVADGEFVVLVGPSGSGKTTVLRMVAGLDGITDGEVCIGNRVVNELPPRERDVAMVFQNYALYPHMTVFENMAFALRVRGVAAADVRTRVRGAAALLSIEGLLERLPRQLSGGERQRVAMGRAIVREPAAFLMDEPLSNLDAQLRVHMRAELATLQRRLGTTTLYVTHDQTEAMTMGDRVAVLERGVLQQVDAPQTLYEHPRNLFVARFIGAPAMNVFRTRLEAGRDGEVVVWLGGHALPLPATTLDAHPRLRRFVGHAVDLGLRAEDLDDGAPEAGPPRASVRAEVVLLEPTGAEVLAHCRLSEPGAATPGSIVARLRAGTTARRGQATRLDVDLHRLYFFDPGTGDAVAWPCGSRTARPAGGS